MLLLIIYARSVTYTIAGCSAAANTIYTYIHTKTQPCGVCSKVLCSVLFQVLACWKVLVRHRVHSEPDSWSQFKNVSAYIENAALSKPIRKQVGATVVPSELNGQSK